MELAVVEETVVVGGLRFTAEVQGDECPACGECYLSGETVRALEQGVAEALARGGIGTADAFRYMRKVIGLKALEVAGLFGVAPETVSRWENGERRPEPRAVKGLGALVVEHLAGRTDLLDYLQTVGPAKSAEDFAERRIVIS
jgi:putative zinc finger/helix-turn-helix YgiT family protein